jgi:hypothetical protein
MTDIRDLIEYDPETGLFRWLVKRASEKQGWFDGCPHTKGYRTIRANRKLHKAHRLAWFMTYGEWPTLQIDHINGIRHDNRIANLRLATPSQNQRNRRCCHHSSTGLKNVYQTATGKFMARVKLNGRRQSLGCYTTPEEAANVARKAAEAHYGEYAK